MEESLDVLLKLQDIDSEISRIRSQRDGIPAKLDEIDSLVRQLKQDLVDKESRLKNAKLAIREAESKVAQLDQSTNKYKQQLLAVKTNREYSALLTELEAVKKEKLELEDVVITKMEESERVNGELGETREHLAAKEKEHQAERDILTGELNKLDEEIAVRVQKRENLAVRVKRPVLNLYERIMGSRLNHAVVALRNGSCGGCHALVPLQKVADIRKAKEIHTCENCGRILYYEENGNGS